MHIVFASDNGFVKQLLVASGSALYATRRGNRTTPISIHVLDCGISDETWIWYESKMAGLAERSRLILDLQRHLIDMNQFEDLPRWTNGSKASWARILIPEILRSVDRCIYSDCDMLFFADPEEMLREPAKPGILMAGHLNPFGRYSPDARWHRRQGLPYDDIYVCSGLVTLDLRGFRNERLVEKCFEFATNYPTLVSVDQTVLNNVCRGRTALLPDGWGLFTHECHLFDGQLKAIHYSGGWPWVRCKNVYDALCLSCTQVEVDLWRDFERYILGIDPSKQPQQKSLIRKVLARGVQGACRLANHMRLSIPGRECLLELVAAYDGQSRALGEARRELFR